MGTVESLVHAGVAEAPLPFVAVVALPVAGIRPRATRVAENTCFQPPCWILIGHHTSPRCLFKSPLRPPIPMPSHDMRVLVARGVSPLWRALHVRGPGRPAETIPVGAAFAEAVARLADVVGAGGAAGAVVVEGVLDVVF